MEVQRQEDMYTLPSLEACFYNESNVQQVPLATTYIMLNTSIIRTLEHHPIGFLEGGLIQGTDLLGGDVLQQELGGLEACPPQENF